MYFLADKKCKTKDLKMLRDSVINYYKLKIMMYFQFSIIVGKIALFAMITIVI